MLLTVFMLVAATPAICVFADLGDFNDYDSGSSYDYDYDYGGGYDYDDDYYYSGDYSGGGSSTGFDFFAAVIIVIVILIIAKRKGGGNGGNGGSSTASPSRPGASVRVDDHTNDITEAIQRYDEKFSSEKFISWVKEVFITLQTAWSERDFEKVRPFEKEELYRQHEAQIRKYIENNRINVLDRINVNQAYLYKYVRDDDYEYMKVYIQSRMTDYIKDATTGNVIKGDPNTEYHLRYIYTFMRKTGVVTDPAQNGRSVVACPHCGAPTSITSAGRCEYCGFIVTTGEFGWVLSNIEAIKDGMTMERGGVQINFSNKADNEDSNDKSDNI